VVARQFFERGVNSVSLVLASDLAVASAPSCSVAAASTSRSSFTLSGFCAENSSDSRMNLSSILNFRFTIYD
jgi:hypothetical protein